MATGTIDYPLGLPTPAKIRHLPSSRAVGTDLPGKLEAYAKALDYFGRAELEFFFTAQEAEAFHTWWKDDLREGGYWFNCGWPGLAPGPKVVQFLASPAFNHAGVGAYRVVVQAQIRGQALPVRSFIPCLEGPVWSAVTMPNLDKRSGAAGLGRFVVPVLSSGNSSVRYSLDDAATWLTPLSYPAATLSTPAGTVFNGRGFYTTNNAVSAAWSEDAVSWANRTTGFGGVNSTAAFMEGNNAIFAISSTSASARSLDDGASHTLISPTLTGANNAAQAGQYMYAYSLVNNAFYYSEDCVTWGACTKDWGSINGGMSIAYGNGVYVATGDSTASTNWVFRSLDGRNWTRILNALPNGPTWAGVLFANGVFFAWAVNRRTPVVSLDGLAWQDAANDFATSSPSVGHTYVLYDQTADRYLAYSSGFSDVGNIGFC